MRHKTPHFGPFAGQLCQVLEDGTLQPAPEPDCSVLAPVAVQGVPSDGRVTIEQGEIAGYETRANREKLRRSIVDNGGSEEWAAKKANNAVTNWDLGIRGGRLVRRRN